MVPDSFHSFFEASAGVSGALIGLLFVAISVAPERLHRRNDPTFRIRAGIAFAALTNTLLMTLIALLPGAQLATAGVILSIGGLISAPWLAWESRSQHPTRARIGSIIRIAALAGLFVAQIVFAIRLGGAPRDRSLVSNLGYLTLVAFGMAIERSWELVGAFGNSLLAHLERASALGQPLQSDDRSDHETTDRPSLDEGQPRSGSR